MRKRIMALLMAVVMLISLTACSTGDSKTSSNTQETTTNQSNEDTKDSGNTTINFRYWADNTDYSILMQSIIKKFNEENGKGITVVGEETPWDGGAYSENLFNAAMGGGGPDCATWKLTSTPLFMNNNLLANLSPYLKEWDGYSDIDENMYNVMKEASGTDDVYVMPWNVQVLYVYYRPSIFEAAGVEVPTTYEEFLEAVKKCTMDTDGDGKTDVYGFGMRGGKGGQEPWGSFIHGEGGNFEDLTSADSVKGMQDFIDLYKNGYVPPTATSDGYNEIIANFQSGLTAMTIHHTGSSANMVEALGDDVSAFPFPAGKGQWTSMGDTETVIFESCENKEAAFEWLTYLATGEGQKMWCEGTGNVPVSKTVQAGDYFQNDPFMKASIAGQSYAGILPILDTTTEWVSSIWPNTVGMALAGNLTAEECMEKLQNELYK
ncbi:ABC transporter substrate-binding protein [Candidatus Galacturonibacter soehngenii]|uniref:Sugar ABC transporter substrate-binding protein n=1 Tax=Candidatus Galacturonatibacter soehngenii TaxID=2307010 RepID=A0A7V7QK60_9FIRM|nr:sugar ABC transporter substrate-binding protein [Candidatus Galacturonibacter soehngenii]KAB1438128.1 sugar ABC transporter substrate-binding protein [Candidatus Galacturonibacter soehngenii]